MYTRHLIKNIPPMPYKVHVVSFLHLKLLVLIILEWLFSFEKFRYDKFNYA